MIIDDSKFTTYSAICAIVLREVRVQRGMHRAQIADYFAKPSSAWENIESGKARIDFDVLLRVCRGLFLSPGMLLQAVDAYDMFLRAQGWSVAVTDNELKTTDALMTLAHEYWTTPGGRHQDSQPMMAVAPVLNAPYLQNNVWYGLAPVFLYAVNEPFRTSQQNFQIPPAAPIVQPYQSIFDLASPVPPVTTTQAPTGETTDADA